MASFDPRAVGRTYGSVAKEYAASFAGDLEYLPLDRHVLDEVARSARHARSAQPVVDLGCGPGHVAAYLHAAGPDVVGIDVAAGMLATARRRQDASGCYFSAGDVRQLPLRAASCAGAVAFYSLQHTPRADLSRALMEIRRVLVRGALLAIGTHLGQGELASPTDWMGHQVESMAVTLYRADELQSALARGSFTIEDVQYRDPLPHEYQGPRIYVTAARSA